MLGKPELGPDRLKKGRCKRHPGEGHLVSQPSSLLPTRVGEGCPQGTSRGVPRPGLASVSQSLADPDEPSHHLSLGQF